MKIYSKIVLSGLIAFMICVNLFYYPKWKQTGTEAVLSWDVSGYYMYLPAIFIYNDVRNCSFVPPILAEYTPTPDFQQGYVDEESGHCVFKYSMGQAVLLSPFFFLAHAWASNSESYPADGFSFPYQICISLGCLGIAIIGLIVLSKVLNYYFPDSVVAMSLAAIVLGSNYLNYTSIDGALTHNALFTLYALILYTAIKFYRNPTFFIASAIGLLVGLAALVRPTEIMTCLIPMFWGVDLFSIRSITSRLQLIKIHWLKILIAIIVCCSIGCLQLCYWYYTTGQLIVYSYQDQGFSWLSPHIIDGLFSYRSGWLTYSPIMIFSVIGLAFLYMWKRSIASTCIIFMIIFMYVTFSWDIWWYGGSLGQRAMVQSYPILGFSLCALFYRMQSWRYVYSVAVFSVIIFFSYTNLWFTHQAHLGGILYVGQMTRPYFWSTLLTFEIDTEKLKLLDQTSNIYQGERRKVTLIYEDSLFVSSLNENNQFSSEVSVKIDSSTSKSDWLRVSADFTIGPKEWDTWKMTQFSVTLRSQQVEIKRYMIRTQRHMVDNQTKNLYIDIRMSQHIEPDNLTVQFWNGGSDKPVRVNNLLIESYDEN